MDLFTWPVAIAIVGGAMSLFAFLNDFLKKPKDAWKKPIEELEKKVAILESQIKNLDTKIEKVDSDQSDLDNKLFKRIDALDEKFDKFVEVMINYFTKK